MIWKKFKRLKQTKPLVVLSIVSSGPQIILSLQPDQEVSLFYNPDLSAPGLKRGISISMYNASNLNFSLIVKLSCWAQCSDDFMKYGYEH